MKGKFWELNLLSILVTHIFLFDFVGESLYGGYEEAS